LGSISRPCERHRHRVAMPQQALETAAGRAKQASSQGLLLRGQVAHDRSVRSIPSGQLGRSIGHVTAASAMRAGAVILLTKQVDSPCMRRCRISRVHSAMPEAEPRSGMHTGARGPAVAAAGELLLCEVADRRSGLSAGRDAPIGGTHTRPPGHGAGTGRSLRPYIPPESVDGGSAAHHF